MNVPIFRKFHGRGAFLTGWHRKNIFPRLLAEKAGFSMIELMAVVAIVAVISNIAIIRVGTIMAKTRDARRLLELATVQSALQNFYLLKKKMPGNYNCAGTFCSGGGSYGACERGGWQTPDAWPASMQELVDAGLLQKIPHDPDPRSLYGYCYYDYGSRSVPGSLVVATLETEHSATGRNPSCRPFAAGTNWCDQSDDSWYCLCGSY